MQLREYALTSDSLSTGIQELQAQFNMEISIQHEAILVLLGVTSFRFFSRAAADEMESCPAALVLKYLQVNISKAKCYSNKKKYIMKMVLQVIYNL